MNAHKSRIALAARRGELMAELFFQELNPVFVSRPTDDVGYDLLVGFRNERAGTNTFTVEVKSTTRPLTSRYPLRREVFDRMIHSNIPGLLLVADVKQNRLYYAWLKSTNVRRGGDVVSVRVTEIDESSKPELQKQLGKAGGGVAAAG
jgi:hypothetical protein